MTRWLHLACGSVYSGKTPPFECLVCHGEPGWKRVYSKGEGGPQRRKKWLKNRRQKVFARDGFMCRQCGSTDDLTLDHIVPLSKGGSNFQSNLQTLCASCNCAKADSMPKERVSGTP